ncbi:MAG: hypothetical protein AB1918_04575 [Pseudomonadota bacterium]
MAISALSGADAFLNTIERMTAATRNRGAAGLPPTVAADYRPGGVATIGLGTSRDLVDKASAAARDITGWLESLAGMARQARDTGYLNGVPDISAVTLTADAQILVDRIDAAVRGAAAGGFNLLAGEGREFTIATTGLGGAVSVRQFGFDSRSLGLGGLDFTSAAGIDDANARIAVARSSVTADTIRIDALARMFGVHESFMGDLRAAIAGQVVGAVAGSGYGADGRGSAPTATRGTLVNLRI